jgi:tetratricopeptide (TPR) repeat protein
MPPRLRRWFNLTLARWCGFFQQRETALKYLRAALAAAPDDPLVLSATGVTLAELGHRREALACFDRALAATPAVAELHFNRGFMLQGLRDDEAAIAAFRRAIELDPKHDRAHYGLALSLISLKRIEEAVAPLKENTKLQPMSPYGWYQLGRVRHALGQHEKAQQIVDRLGAFEPKVAAQLARETGLVAPPKP